jgi:hypothetical protein
MLRDASELLWPAVAETIASLDLQPEDAAAKKLAQRYAQIIDDLPDHAPRGTQDQAWAMRWLGPLLLDVLVQLGATPAARKAPKTGGDNATGTVSWLDAQLAARAKRATRRA